MYFTKVSPTCHKKCVIKTHVSLALDVRYYNSLWASLAERLYKHYTKRTVSKARIVLLLGGPKC